MKSVYLKVAGLEKWCCNAEDNDYSPHRIEGGRMLSPGFCQKIIEVFACIAKGPAAANRRPALRGTDRRGHGLKRRARLGEQIGEFFRGEQGVRLMGLAAVKGAAAVAAFASIHAQSQVGNGAKPLFEGFVLFDRQ